ncbi:unnamed protein product [Nezara viridula]|uniref:Uncharacterized protein n=1 Tax=Nezara viridula TaxID=85310 RepID=A0A9P0E1L8_NEZVI|nr:unnamed protein product [Nezara viridula]
MHQLHQGPSYDVSVVMWVARQRVFSTWVYPARPLRCCPGLHIFFLKCWLK